jgi:hypothetical protein
MNNLTPFDLEAAKRGEPIVYRSGQRARFVAHVPEAVMDEQVITLGDAGRTITHTANGSRFLGPHDNYYDLFMAPKPVDVFINIYEDNRDRLVHNTADSAKSAAGKAISLAKITVLNGEAVSVETVHKY